MEKFSCGVPQGSLSEPILFKIYLADVILFWNQRDVCNFAKDTTPFLCHENPAELLEKLE